MRMNLAVLGVAVIGCTSSGSSGSGKPGQFQVADAISAAVTITDGAGDTNSSAWIVLASTANLCADASASPPIDRKGQQAITIQLANVSAGVMTTPTAAGTFTVYPNTGSQPANEALVQTAGLDATCQAVDAESAAGESGTVTLSAIAGDVFSGSYDVVLNTGGELKGTFTPTACPQLMAEMTSMAAHSCQ